MHNIAESKDEAENHKWYMDFPKSVPPTEPKKHNEAIAELKLKAQKALNGESAAYELKQSRTRGSEYSWLKTALTKGTSSDKVAASVVLIQDSPKYNLSRLTSLIANVKVSKSNHCNNTMLTLKDLFINDLLHPDLKLVKFEDQNFEKLNSETNSNKLLAHWYFEDQLKECYSNFLSSIMDIASNGVEANRLKAIGVLSELLINNSEQEQKLLSILVNKIGDPSSTVSSKSVFCLMKLLNEHPNMKGVILNEVEKLLFRPNLAPRVQYYAICLLTQFVLDKEDEEVATGLIDVYFAFFKACLKKGEPKSKMMGAILTGVYRAYSFAKIDSENIKEHVDALFKVVHLGTFGVSLCALNLLFQISRKNPAISDRFYSAFYKKLFDKQIGSSCKRTVFLNLFLRAVRQDNSVNRSAALIKRLLHTSLYFPPNMICAVLLIISQILKSRKDLRLFFSKSHIFQIKQEDLKKGENQPLENVQEKEIENETRLDDTMEIKDETQDIVLSNVAVGPDNICDKDSKQDIDIKEEIDQLKDYDPFCRNPLYAGARNANFLEINALISHFHPSVALLANQIMKGENIYYSGDPLKDLTAIRFLDRFVFKNPKKMTEIDQKKRRDPLARNQVHDPQGVRKIAIDSDAYINTDESCIPVDELFLYRYMQSKKTAKDKENSDSDDNESVNSEEFNEMLDNMQGKNNIDDFDIASDYVAGTKKKQKVSNNDNEDEDDDDDDEEINNDDDENFEEDEAFEDEINDLDSEDLQNLSDENGEEFADLSDLDLDELDDDASDIEFSDNEEVKTKKGKNKNESVFMSAEKFSEMLEEQGLSELKSGGSNTLSNADGTNYKQIKWEMNRNHKNSGKQYMKKSKSKQIKMKPKGKAKKKQKR